MNLIKIKKSQKGFTLIEVILVITLIGILIAIGLVSFNAEARFIDARNDIRKTHIQTLESAISQYKLQEGNYPTGLSRNYQEICDPEATDCTGFFNLKQFLVPTYLPSIPQDPNDEDTTGGNGYSLAVDVATNTVSIRAIQAEGGVEVKINDPLPAQESVTTNTPLAATVPKLPIVTDGLILYLDAGNTTSYPGTGNTWFDLSGNGKNGTLTNGPTYSSSNGGSIVFDGTNDNIQLGNTSNIISTLQSQITVNTWVKTNVVGAYKKILVNVTAGTQAITGIYFSIGPSPFNTYFGLTTSGGQAQAIYTQNISTSLYSNLCGTYDGSNLRLYLNGTLVATQSHTGTIGNTGITRISGYDNNNETWNGNIAKVSVYNRALTATEIQQNFNATRGRFGL